MSNYKSVNYHDSMLRDTASFPEYNLSSENIFDWLYFKLGAVLRSQDKKASYTTDNTLRDKKTERQKDRKTERQKDRKTERQKDRQHFEIKLQKLKKKEKKFIKLTYLIATPWKTDFEKQTDR
jgi:hypothetical protein